jgi:hypothetical protein
LLAGPGKVISIGSMAATQSPCTAPAPSTQSGRVIERLSVKGRSFRSAAARSPPDLRLAESACDANSLAFHHDAGC